MVSANELIVTCRVISGHSVIFATGDPDFATRKVVRMMDAFFYEVHPSTNDKGEKGFTTVMQPVQWHGAFRSITKMKQSSIMCWFDDVSHHIETPWRTQSNRPVIHIAGQMPKAPDDGN